MNRFTGVREEATAKGWRTKEQLESEYWTRQAQEQASKEQKESEEKAARQRQLEQIFNDLKRIKVSSNRSDLDRIILSNPSSWDLEGSYNNTTIEYYVRDGGTEEFLTKQETTNRFMKAYSMNDFKLHEFISEFPSDVSSLPAGSAFSEKIFIQFDTATNRDTGEAIKLKPAFVWKHTRTWKVPSSE
ncbi:MAG TPA: hypothetical protein VJU86_07445 [Pyrinomonadaceae bacterium]|nr:hypothetical protein [Pyrinomonadaceae bacterium]